MATDLAEICAEKKKAEKYKNLLNVSRAFSLKKVSGFLTKRMLS
jgi:hypothetical protein